MDSFKLSAFIINIKMITAVFVPFPHKVNKSGTLRTSDSAQSAYFAHCRRKKWFRVARRNDKPTKSNYFCCEDHFEVS